MFDQVILLDKYSSKLGSFRHSNYICLQGDAEDQNFITQLLKSLSGPALFINLCSNVNNVKIRETVSQFDLAYIDSCASTTPENKLEYRFSRMMPYTLTQLPCRFPHWLCWGINPGLVEIITRKLIDQFQDTKSRYDVAIFEHDQLYVDKEHEKIAVGWCVDALVEEIMLSPTLQILDGQPIEEKNNGAKKILALWQGIPIFSKIVAHEDIWNIGTIDCVSNAKFIYALHPKAMKVLDGDPQKAFNTLFVPEVDVPVFGEEKVAVVVKNINSGQKKSLIWEVNHQQVWNEYGVNAVQFQTSKSLLLAILLMQKTPYGTMPGTFCAADLPISPNDWKHIENFTDELGIYWEDGEHLKLHTQKCSDTTPIFSVNDAAS